MLLLAFACEVPNFGFANTCTNGIQGSDEPSPACQAAQGASCSDGVTNGSETDVDCGGACPACRAGQSCRADGDCDSTHCELGICQSASCDDGIANGSESDIDCGSSCTPCADSKMCHDENDCKSEVCNAGVCQQPTCTDHKKNGDETDVDCGGLCPRCPLGSGCATANDCQSQSCAAQDLCVGAGCSDQTKNGDETDVDCGGAKCAPCAANQHCLVNGDCDSAICDAKTEQCVAASCSDAVQNQGESDLDCGGEHCSPCGVGKNCLAAADCASGLCQAELCVPTQATGAPLPRNGWQLSASNSDINNQPARAIDGDEMTRWSSGINQYAGMWVQVDLGQPQIFFSVVIDSAANSGDHAQEFNIFFSDTPTFGAAARTGIVGSDVTTVTFDTPIVARYIELQLATGYTLWWSIDELNVLQ